jgi:prevent-host-death family protein
MIVNMHDAKTRLSKLVRQVEAGEEIIIARNGEPVARLVPYGPSPVRLGLARDEVWLSDGWDSDEANAEIAALFDGE